VQKTDHFFKGSHYPQSVLIHRVFQGFLAKAKGCTLALAMEPTIGIDTKNYGLYRSGIYHATVPCLRSLVAAHPGWVYRMIGPDAGNDVLEAPNLETQNIKLPMGPPYGEYLYNVTSFPLRFKPNSVNLLYSPYYDLLLPAGTNAVVTIHDLLYFRLPGLYKARLVTFYQWIAKRNAEAAKFIITDSKQSQTDIVRFLGVPLSKVKLVYPSLDPAWKEPALVHNPWLEGKQDGKKRLLYTGGLEARKNLGRLAEAVKLLGRDYQLWVTGDKVKYTQVVPGLAELDRLGQVSWLGVVRPEQIKGLYEACDALVYPSLWEGFGMPVLEARATGLPVACAQMASIPEVAGDKAFYFDPLDTQQMTEAIRQAASAKQLAPEFPEAFDQKKNHRKFIQVMEAALS